MFTIIRLMLTKQADRRWKQRPVVIKAPPPLQAGQADGDPGADGRREGNPWKKELDRLANARDLAPINPLYRRASQLPSPERPAAPPKKGTKQGTLTDLSAWWGKSLTCQTLSPGSNLYRKVPPKSIKRWQQ